ncbi:anaerobic magnesium-protoporphyrin IX monomethyl ester oxidative cyclase-related enzyme [Geotalea daltonii FRC-32]|uniref:Anaerobic magnesium-protoporphyrin IX monomethyl ester oxidative cyclase-related enzyme n=1 Tax=Geotalea daltonii (strain DSM 22248 / JCM 15807 / FRC-32) TaxID=316067 RepID=B9M7Y5_GEODF|nr:cobalamin-dependent protein [Geotalea daltonii]ACM18443.1 anaerobic magnesium-protoporphyrin IX monomethyl ester oxidative cyclase-related enzyme [Geotalea daltonii FRC-32]
MEASRAKKILFVTPPYHCGVVEVAGRWIPLNFVYLAGVAREAGLDAEIYDAMTKDHGYPEIEQRLQASTFDVVATTAITSTINDALKTLQLAKQINPNAVSIIGGVHPTFCYEEVFNTTDAVDYIICGEGETTLKALLMALEKGTDVAEVPGVAFKRDGRVIKTAKRCFRENLDDLPAAWDLLDWSDYKYFVIPNSRLGAISTSRGCDHDCIFCSQQKFWEQSWRGRDPQKVADEIQYLFEIYGVNVFLIADEYPTKDRERWEALLDMVIAKDLPIYLLMETRVPDIIRDREILWKYRKAGVVHIYIGIEATDQETLDFIKKELDVDQSKLALDLIHEHGIITETSFVLGFPDETKKSIEKTLKLAQYYNPDNAHFLAITPWPYADMFNDVKDYIKVHDYAKYNLIDPIIEPKRMSLLQVDVAIVDCYRRFYMKKLPEVFNMKDPFKRDYLMKAMKLIMNSSFIIKKLGKGTLGKVPAMIEEMMAKMS